jgi:cytochrome oxidase Cu insertion factor (SCO1/SenC/PrrC family)
MLNKFSIIFFAGIVLLGLIPGCQATGSSTAYGNKVGNLAQDFVLKDLSGDTVSLSGFIGRPVIVHFWSTT